MKNYLHISHAFRSHNVWLNGIVIIFGYLWFISGIDKIMSGVFVSGFNTFAAENYLGNATYPLYATFVDTVIVPYGFLFAYAIEWGELLIGIAMILGGAWLLFRDSKLVHMVLALANIGGAFLVLNIILAEGGSLFPMIDTSMVYEEGVSIDVIVFLVALLIVAANLAAFFKEWKEKGTLR